MADASEICIVTADGSNYDIWETVEVTRSAETIVDHAMLTVSEISTAGGTGFSQQKLSPGAIASITLGGVQAMTGYVYLRQAAMDKRTHAVQIGICSNAQATMRTTVTGTPGQYLNQTLQQIASAVFGQVGVGFTIVGSPPGADLPFERVSETIGQTRFAFIENLCRLRNLHMVDDGKGNINAFRGPQGSPSGGSLWMNFVTCNVTVTSPLLIPGGTMTFVIKEVTHRQNPDGTTTDIHITNEFGLGTEPLFPNIGRGNTPAMLKEGVNILKGRLLLKVDDSIEEIFGFAQTYRKGAPGAQIKAEQTLQPTFSAQLGGNLNFLAANAADQASLQMSVNHVADANYYKTVDGVITVQGWFT